MIEMQHNSITDYATFVDELFSRQMRDWPQAAARYAALAHVHSRTLELADGDGHTTRIVLQFNPERIRSSAANVDDAALKVRECFLCDEHQPAEQEKVVWRGCYKIQINPYPIFPRHLTISCIGHTPQRIGGRMAHMVALARDLQGWVVFYNGPKCGASAPDHMHFQAGNADFLPALQEMLNMPRHELFATGQACMSVVIGMVRPIVLISASDDGKAVALFNRLQQAMPMRYGDDEPMQNILCWSERRDVRIAVFPRRKHRPDCYGSGVGQFTLSPASVDLGGVWAVPVERDYFTLTAQNVRDMLCELCSTPDQVESIIDNLDFSNLE